MSDVSSVEPRVQNRALPSRRALVKGAAWAAPVAAMSVRGPQRMRPPPASGRPMTLTRVDAFWVDDCLDSTLGHGRCTQRSACSGDRPGASGLH